MPGQHSKPTHFEPENTGWIFRRNICIHLQILMASQLRKDHSPNVQLFQVKALNRVPVLCVARSTEWIAKHPDFRQKIQMAKNILRSCSLSLYVWRIVTHRLSVLIHLHTWVCFPSSRQQLIDRVTEAAISWILARHIEIEFLLLQKKESSSLNITAYRTMPSKVFEVVILPPGSYLEGVQLEYIFPRTDYLIEDYHSYLQSV